MATFVLVHGGWGGGWEWRSVAEGLQELGHVAYRPTLTGLGERRHLGGPDVDLETHIADVLAVLDFEELDEVILCGQSYGGAVVTGVADRAPARIRRLVYVDAFVLGAGESVLTHTPPDLAQHMRILAAEQGDGWGVPIPFGPDDLGTPPELSDWYFAKLTLHPLASFEQPLRLTGAVDAVPKTYVSCARPGEESVFAEFAAQAREAGWACHDVPVGHDPQVIAPDRLVALLHEVAG